MEDPIRPSKQAFKAMYERGYRTWATLSEMAAGEIHLVRDCLSHLQSAFPNHPYFPRNLIVDKSFSNTVTVRGRTTWITTQGSCDLPPFRDEVIIPVASSHPMTVVLTSNPRHPAKILPDYFGREESNHIPVLILAWAYILSARWAELIPGASSPEYNSNQAPLGDSTELEGPGDDPTSMVVDVGDVDDDAARWWTAILDAEGGWNALISSDKGDLLCSPWSTRIKSEQSFVVSANVKLTHPRAAKDLPASFTTACRYLSEYCHYHSIAEQSQAALAATLLIPVAKFDNRQIELPIPQLFPRKPPRMQEPTQTPPAWDGGLHQLDRLLTLSCNARATKALLNSVFFEPDVACNICGAWLQGTFAFLDSARAANPPSAPLHTLIKRNPNLGFLWLGAFITGAQACCFREVRQAWWKVDLSAAAWTGTHASFIQELVPNVLPDACEISRADECRLMYLSHDVNNTNTPLFPFAPFGSTAMEDTTLDVRRHARCGATTHGLEYAGFTWDCLDGEQGRRSAPDGMVILGRSGDTGPSWESAIDVDYAGLEVEEDDEASEMVTRNIFTWLRGEEGFPVAERAIREHEWIDNLDSDDDGPIEGEVRSSVGGDLHG
ncbi:hypothetical protein QBC33DRAFT_501462 [Phialemonium atrogriseum]|uniref:Immunoglobulin variable region used by the itc63b heavy chain n=1 Tax=Phialemonium atrogriseum TaxID=1093897 RepID=A0AAJ0FHN2_9PEZI|nr:uncharacterized protein QBC33DRAFT_501462 [Phialemonium atrogriseum]KAK1762344.1 hypothetical protein QBC33DRAFT_501462 [Phialemonium atrogriseum]